VNQVKQVRSLESHAAAREARTKIEPPEGDLAARIEQLAADLTDIKEALIAQERTIHSAKPDAHTIRRLIRARRLREEVFGPELFADPAWDILLEAYACHLAQQRVSVSELSEAAAVPNTTALRWFSKLESDGWLQRIEDPLDRRRLWVELTDTGVSAMEKVTGEAALASPI
jgi:DNA-binding MarR family transcriptional regulator